MVQQGFGSRSFRARGFRLLALTLGVAVILAGCATITKDAPPEAKREAVTERVNARWAALIKGDMDTAYTFLSPASRTVTSLAAYKAEARGKGFRKATIEKVECESETCKVTLTVVYDHPKMQGIPTLDQEYWVIDDGKYWYVWRH
jgi:uncharacterized protein YceK